MGLEPGQGSSESRDRKPKEPTSPRDPILWPWQTKKRKHFLGLSRLPQVGPLGALGRCPGLGRGPSLLLDQESHLVIDSLMLGLQTLLARLWPLRRWA